MPDVYVSEKCLVDALKKLHGTADHMIKIWFVLKQMGMRDGGDPVVVNTGNPTDALSRLFSFGDRASRFFIPFAHTDRFKTMAGDAGRSIVQTNLVRWGDSASVVGTDPTGFLDIETRADRSVSVRTGRTYPIGLGVDEKGFAIEDGKKSAIPINAFAAWYYRQTALPEAVLDDNSAIRSMLIQDLGLTASEVYAVFSEDPDFEIIYANEPLSDQKLYKLCTEKGSLIRETVTPLPDLTVQQQARVIRTMKTISERPDWLNQDPAIALEGVIASGQRAVMLYGPPRTGKTRAIKKLLDGKTKVLELQIHDGWTYDNLVEMFAPDKDGKWDWLPGPLKKALADGADYVILEEANRTNISQALGEVFSLLEGAYRGNDRKLTLRSGNEISVGSDTMFFFTMNTVDKSTEDVDDALFGRLAAVEFPPRIEDLVQILDAEKVEASLAQAYRELWSFIQEHYPLGHGYFVDCSKFGSPRVFYQSKIRPVLYSHFQSYNRSALDLIDNKADELLPK